MLTSNRFWIGVVVGVAFWAIIWPTVSSKLRGA